MATLLKVLNNLADIKSAGGVALRVRTQALEQAKALLTLKPDELEFPLLRAVSKTPLVDRTGRLITQSGYDPQSFLYYEFDETVFPSLPEKLGKDEAIDFLKLLKEPFKLYPFELHQGETADRSVALSVCVAYLITMVNRPMWNLVPGFAFNGNRPRVGKAKSSSVAAF